MRDGESIHFRVCETKIAKEIENSVLGLMDELDGHFLCVWIERKVLQQSNK